MNKKAIGVTNEEVGVSDLCVVMLTPTFKQLNNQEFDLRCLSLDDVQMLRTQDPFMYHSIPAVHKATLALLEIDVAKNALTQACSLVTRKTRVSTECHVSLLMKDLFDDEEFHDMDFDTSERLVESVSPRSALEDWLNGRFDDAGVFGDEHQPEQ
jgi:hypothetical protein